MKQDLSEQALEACRIIGNDRNVGSSNLISDTLTETYIVLTLPQIYGTLTTLSTKQILK